jgi:hypothetical protein
MNHGGRYTTSDQHGNQNEWKLLVTLTLAVTVTLAVSAAVAPSHM